MTGTPGAAAPDGPPSGPTAGTGGSGAGGGGNNGGGGGGRNWTGGGGSSGRLFTGNGAPGPVTVPSRHVVAAVKQSAADEPCSAFPLIVPVQVKTVPPAPAAGAAQATAWMPTAVLNTATGVMPAISPAGTAAVSVKVTLLLRVSVPVTAPATVQVCPTITAHGAPAMPVKKPAVPWACVWAWATVRLLALFAP